MQNYQRTLTNQQPEHPGVENSVGSSLQETPGRRDLIMMVVPPRFHTQGQNNSEDMLAPLQFVNSLVSSLRNILSGIDHHSGENPSNSRLERENVETLQSSEHPLHEAGHNANATSTPHRRFLMVMIPVGGHASVHDVLNNLFQTYQPPGAPPATAKVLDNLKHISPHYNSLQGCSICLESFTEERTHDVIELTCKHLFCNECIVSWLKQHNTCPVCRSPQVDEEIPSNSNPSTAMGE